MALRFDAEQRFTCQSCARCCQRWEIAVTADEVEAYRKAGAERWFREGADAAEGTEEDPFAPAGRGAYRIRKRPDGACGFLSPQNRCRLHEELGAERKPLTCRLFPFRFHPAPADDPPVLTLSFSCPTVAANDGAPVSSQLSMLNDLRKQWTRRHAEQPGGIVLVPGRPLRHGALGTLREVLRAMLDRPGADGAPDLRESAARMAATLDDVTRRRVLLLEDHRFAEYLELTGRYAAKTEKPVARRMPSRVARLLFRGLLVAVVAARLQSGGIRKRVRRRLFGVLLHLHGLWPPVAGVDRGAARRTPDPLADPAVRARARNYLRAALETMGQGPRPVLEELAVAVALLNAALALAAMRAGQAARPVGVEDFTAGLNEAADLGHAGGGLLRRFIGTFAAGVEAFHALAHPRPL